MDQEFAFRPEVHKGLRANFLKLYNTHGYVTNSME